MKIKITLLLILAFGFGYAQTPGLINYQGIGRGIDGAPVTNQAIGIKFEILRGSTSGSVVFSEVQSLTTTTLGLISTQIGLVNTTLSAVNWKNGPFYLRVSVDFTGGTNYVQLGVEQQLLSVPFSMHATSVPASYSAATNELTVGGNSFTLASTPNTSLTTSGVITMTATGTNSYALSVPQTSITLSSTVGSSGISSPGTNSFNINMPPVPTTTIRGAGAAVVSPTTGTNFTVTVPPTDIAMTQTGTTAGVGVVGTNSFNINVPPVVPPTILGAGLASVTTVGNTYIVNVPLLTYNAANGNLTSGSNVVNITQPLSLAGSTLTSGVSTNSVNLNTISPWRQATNAVTLATTSDKVSIGGATAVENLQIESTTSPSVSLLASSNGTSDVMFGTTANHAIARIRYDNALNAMSFLSPANFSFFTAGSSRMQINNIGQVVIGPTTSYAANTALTVGRSGAFTNQLMICGGDNNNAFGGMLTLGENLSNYGVGMSMKLDAGGNRLWFTNDINGNNPVVAIGGYAGAVNGMVVGTGYAGGVQAPNDGLLVQGNMGIGSTNPGTKLEVIGDITIPINNRLVFGTLSSGAGIGEWIQNTSTGLQLVTASVPRMNIMAANGYIGISNTTPTTNLHVNGSLAVGNNGTVGVIQTNGWIRTGCETVAAAPNYPFGSSSGLIIRRVQTTNTVVGTAVATASTSLIFERDGLGYGGFRITRTGGNGLETCTCMGVNASGGTVNRQFSALPLGSTQVYTNADNITFLHCIFGDPYYSGHITELTLTRYPGDYFWIGTITSSTNQ